MHTFIIFNFEIWENKPFLLNLQLKFYALYITLEI